LFEPESLTISVDNLRELEWRMSIADSETIGVTNALIAMFHHTNIITATNASMRHDFNGPVMAINSMLMDAFQFISAAPIAFQHATVWAVGECLRRPGQLVSESQQLSYARYLFTLLHLSVLFDSSSSLSPSNVSYNFNTIQHQAVTILYGRISQLPSAVHQKLVDWMKAIEPVDEYRRLVERCNRYLTARAQRLPANQLPNDYGLLAGARVAALLFRANDTNRLTAADFYNLTLDDRMDALHHFHLWRLPRRSGTHASHKHPAFLLCNYPFLLTLSSKIAILESECQQRMLTFRAEQFLDIRIRRDYLVTDSMTQLSIYSTADLHRRLRVQFVGESGVDGGGLAREWLCLLTQRLFSPDYGMFTVSSDEESAFPWFCLDHTNRDEEDDDALLEEYYLAGVVLGLAAYNSIIVNVSLPLAAYKLLLSHTVSWHDLKSIRPALYRGLQQMLAHQDPESFENIYCRDFVVDCETIFGERIQLPLVPHGESVAVKMDNRMEYVCLLANWILVDSIGRRFQAFRSGFLAIMDGNALVLFQPEELQAVIQGDADSLDGFDWDSLRAVTEYDGCEDEDPFVE
jgi:hypothetical protein